MNAPGVAFFRQRKRLLNVFVVLALLLAALPASGVRPALAVSTTIVVSQVYGGGGNSGAPYTHDFVELYNLGTTTVSLSGWSIQYTSAAGTGLFGANSGLITELPNVSLAPGRYLLIQEASTAAVGAPLPTPDVVDSTPIAMSASAGKVALVNTTTPLGCNGGSVPCPPAALAQIVDLVGYGGANFFEGSSAAPTLSNTTAALRLSNGAQDTDNNGADFFAGTPNPRNSSYTTTASLSINDVSMNEGNTGTTMFNFTVSLSSPAGAGGVTFDIATADNTATAPSDYTAVSLTGQTIPEGNSTYSFSVLVSGDTDPEPDETFFVNVTNVTGADVADGQGQGTLVDDDLYVCTLAYTPIYNIQGSGMTAAITGNVTTQGVVVGDFEGSASASGFYLQDLTGDANTETSDGIFVYTGSSNLVSPGQVVRVTGYARERFSQTALNGSNSNTAPVTNIVPCGTGSMTPTDVTVPFESNTYLERFEGMLVRLPQALTIAEYFNYDRFGEIVLALPLEGESRAFSPTSIDEPGAPAQARALANGLRRITLDDAQSASNPNTLRHPNGQPFSLTNRFRGGDTVQNTIGVLGFDFSLYRIVPTGPADYTAVNARTTAPEPVGGTLRVGSFNTLNYFLTLDALDDDSTNNPADDVCGGNQNLDCRGADLSQPAEFQRQRVKLLQAIIGLDADVLALNELENTPNVEPLADIVNGLNAELGAGTYAYISTGTIGTDAIKVGMIYKTATVSPVGTHAILNSTVDPRFIDTLNRPALAQTFEEVATGARFTMVANHLKSKGSACPGDPDMGDGQGNCNLTRKAAAQALVDWVATDPTDSGDPDFLITGDLNSYAQEDPIDAIKAGADDTAGTTDDLTNLISQYQGTYAYSYVFDGQAGYLDHALANSSLLGQVTGAADWHINADESDVLDYDTSFKPAAQEALYEENAYRTSDHDPVIVGLNLNAAPDAVDDTMTVPKNGSETVRALDNDTDGNGDDLTVVSFTQGAHGEVKYSTRNNNFRYTPRRGFTGTDSFTYTISDGRGGTDTATVWVTVEPR
jgi:predicted extracellular nuclease